MTFFKKFICITSFSVVSVLCTTACQDKNQNNVEQEQIKKLEQKIAQQEAELQQQKEQELVQKELELEKKAKELEEKELEIKEKNHKSEEKAKQTTQKPKVKSTAATPPIEAYNKRFDVVSEKAYFYNKPHSSTRRKAYMVYGNYGQTEKRSNGYVYVKFINGKGQVSKGWVDENDLTYY